MKRLLYVLAVIGFVVSCLPVSLFAQDTLDVAALPPGNLNTVINGDTLTGGVRAHPDRVYRLTRGSVYQVTEPMRINGSFNIMAPNGTNRPPVLAPAILPDNSSIDHYFDLIGYQSKVNMSNVYLLSQRADNTWLGWSDGIRIGADSVSIKLRNVVFDGFSDAGILLSYWTKADIQDCVFRNHQHASSWFGGQPIMSGAPVCVDTIKVVNNTFIANNSYSYSIRGYDVCSIFEHNTMIFGTVNPFLTRQASNLHLKNNIFYAMHAMGGNPDHVINSWFLNYPDTASSSIVQFRSNDSVSYWSKLWGAAITGPEVYVDDVHHVTPAMVDASKRTLDIRNNAYFWPSKLTDFYKAYNDTVATYDSVDVPVYGTATEVKMRLKHILYKPTWITNYIQWTIDSLASKLSPNIVVSNNMEADPGFAANVAGHIDSLIAYVYKISTGTLDIRWAYPNNTLYPAVWPLPENLAYSNTSMQHAGTDGFALGDLNWFPEQKAAYILTGVKQVTSNIPDGYSLSQNYPNPFNPTTTIGFSLPKQSNVELKVFNVLGQEVATLINSPMAAGRYTFDFDASKLASGTYIYRLKAGDFMSVNKMVLLK